MISLAILRSLISECRRDLGLFSRSIIRIINIALDVRVYQKGDYDLEVVGRAASCFTAFTTYTDGAAVGVDDSLTTAYLAVLRNFAALAVSTGMTEKPDTEQLSRARLIALAGLNGAASSDALFSSNSEFSRQISILLPPLLENIFEGNMHQLKLETAKIQMDASPSPFFSEFSARRPVNDRRAPSLHAHIPGEKGPSTADVLSAALRSLHALVGLCQVNQASSVLDAVFAFLDQRGWMDVEWCCWLAEQLTAFLLLQYRFVVLTRLAEILVELEDVPPTPKHTSVLAMVTTVLNSSISLVGLGVTDLLNNLVSLIVRRIRFEPQDGLLPPLVQCISSLGTHIYYADQINDIVEELTVRMSDIPQSDKARLEILRVLIYCTIGVMTTAVAADAMEARRTSQQEPPPADKGKAPLLETPLELPRKSTSRRNPITPGVWQATLPLLGESTYAVRAAYAQALQLFLENEMIRDQKPLKPSEPAAYRFCNAVHAAVYTLAMSSCLGVGTSEPSVASVQASPEVISSEIRPVEVKAEQNGHSEPKTGEKGVSFILTEPPTGEFRSESTETPTPTRKTSRPSRRVSLPLNRLNSAATLASFDNVATPFDFAAIVNVLDKLHAAVPVAALMTGVPMLLALDRDAGIELVRRPGDGRSGAWVLERKRSIREVVALTWRRLGERWAISSVTGSADKVSRMSAMKLTTGPQFPSRAIRGAKYATSTTRYSPSARRTYFLRPTYNRRRIVLDQSTFSRYRNSRLLPCLDFNSSQRHRTGFSYPCPASCGTMDRRGRAQRFCRALLFRSSQARR